MTAVLRCALCFCSVTSTFSFKLTQSPLLPSPELEAEQHGGRINVIVHMSPQDFGSLDAAEAASVCYQLERELSKEELALKTAMMEEGAIDGLIAVLRKHGRTDIDVADHCLRAMGKAIYYQQELQDYAGAPLQEVTIKTLRAHIDDEEFMSFHIADISTFNDFSQNGDYLYQYGADQLVMDTITKYIDNVYVVQNCLNALTGCLFHTSDGATRVKQYELGLLDVFHDLIKRYPYDPKDSFLQVRQEVMIVTAALAGPSPREREIRDAIYREGFFTEALKLMRQQPRDQPSQAKSAEFIRQLSQYNSTYAEKFVEMGAILHLVESLENYETPTGEFASEAGKFWNVDQAASEALSTLARLVPSCRQEMISAGAVDALIKAAKNPEGGYQTPSYFARDSACQALSLLSEASTSVLARIACQ